MRFLSDSALNPANTTLQADRGMESRTGRRNLVANVHVQYCSPHVRTSTVKSSRDYIGFCTYSSAIFTLAKTENNSCIKFVTIHKLVTATHEESASPNKN